MKAMQRQVIVVAVSILCCATSGRSAELPAVSWKYRHADAMIIGDITSRTTRVIRGDTPLRTEQCVRHYSILVDVYTAAVDTVLKGEYLDSVIVILSQPLARGDTCDRELLTEDKYGNLVLKSRIEHSLRGTVDRITRYGKHIVVIQKYGDCYIALDSRPYREKHGTISGRVVDGGTEEPLPLATVVVEGTDMWGATDWDGHYDILSVSPGKHDVSTTMLGYGEATQKGVRVFKDSTSVVDFFLEPTFFK